MPTLAEEPGEPSFPGEFFDVDDFDDADDAPVFDDAEPFVVGLPPPFADVPLAPLLPFGSGNSSSLQMNISSQCSSRRIASYVTHSAGPF